MRAMQDLDLMGKRVLIRQDLNVPIDEQGHIQSYARIDASLPTLKKAVAAGAKIMVMAHRGRPVEGQYEDQFSLAPVAKALGEKLGQPVKLAKDWLNGVELANGEVVLCENVRFNIGEKANDNTLAKKMAALCDIYIMDAFGTAHRAQASTEGVAQYAPEVCAGELLASEVKALDAATKSPLRPELMIIGGSKVSTKLELLKSLAKVADYLVVGGGIANTFLAAEGYNVGASLYEPDLVDAAKDIKNLIQAQGGTLPLPEDVVVAKQLSAQASARTCDLAGIEDDDMILDVGPKFQAKLIELVKQAKTIVWNGPVGVFEFENFAGGTQALAHAIGRSQAFSLAGGGDTIAAIEKFGVADQVSYISTGGGAFLEFLEGKELPAIARIKSRS